MGFSVTSPMSQSLCDFDIMQISYDHLFLMRLCLNYEFSHRVGVLEHIQSFGYNKYMYFFFSRYSFSQIIKFRIFFLHVIMCAILFDFGCWVPDHPQALAWFCSSCSILEYNYSSLHWITLKQLLICVSPVEWYGSEILTPFFFYWYLVLYTVC